MSALKNKNIVKSVYVLSIIRQTYMR